jgi:hypothetical protein
MPEMRVSVIHDVDGNIHGVIRGPADGPPFHVALKPGDLVSDLGERAETPSELLDGFRVELEGEAKLKRKSSARTEQK